MKSSTKPLWRLYGVAMLIVTGIFVALYFPYLSGQYLYGYMDIGSDTVYAYLPRILFDVNSILHGEFNIYTLQWGLGEFYNNHLYQYLNIVNLPFLLLGEKHVHWALLAATYLKYAAICFFALLFFRRLLRDDRLALVCALLWTYSGYAVLWGQHYGFLTHIVFITASMYAIQLFLEDDRKRFLLIPALAGLAYTSYYFLYMSCYLFAAYSIGYLVFRKAGIRAILKKAGIFALCLTLAVGVAAVSIFPALAHFLESARTSDVLYGANSSSFFVYPIKYLLIYLARLLSNDTLGVGGKFPETGNTNYYEAAILSVSVLFVFMLILLLQSKQWKRVAVCTGACLLALCLGPVSQILNFSDGRQRWSFICCFLEIILIGLGLKYLFCHAGQPDFSKILLRTVLIADGVYLFFLLLLWFVQKKYAFTLNMQTCNQIVAFLVMYSLFLLLIPYRGRRWQSAMLVLLIAVELVVMNYRSVNERTRVTNDEWYNSMYYDGTVQIADWLRNRDDSLYRVNRNYDSIGYNASLIQGFNGVAIYNSTNAEELINFYRSLGNSLVNGKATQWIHFSADDDVVNALLGVKYLIVPPESEPDETMYKEIYRDGDLLVYENQYDLGFGYLYREQMPQRFYKALQLRKHALTKSYYFTDGETTGPVSAEIGGIKDFDIIPNLRKAFNCDVEVRTGMLYVRATGDESLDMQLLFRCGNLPEGWSVESMTVEMSMPKAATAQVFVQTDEQGYSEEQSVRYAAKAGENVCYFDLSKFDDPIELRFDPANLSQDVEIRSITLQLATDAAICDNLAELRENRITDFTQNGDTFTGSITNPWEEDAMLCIPLIYSDHWRAEVDGETAEVQNINGGLVGIKVDSGLHRISITYHDHTQRIGEVIGLTLFLIYTAGAVIWWRRKGRFEAPMDFHVCGEEPVTGRGAAD